MKKFVVSGESSLKNFTDSVCAQASFCFRALLKNKEIRVNGKKVGADMPVHAGDEVQYFLTPAQEAKRAFEIVYEDENVLVADKESGVNSEAVFAELAEKGEFFFIHRLDRNTAGLMIFAKTPAAEEELLSAFRERRAEKIYHALVLGHMPERRALLAAYLTKDEKKSLVRVSAQPQGEKILTEYEVLREMGETSLLKITLHTGKTHQIRAHLAFVGHPVAGDTKYGNGVFNRAHSLTRQRLVAKELSLQTEGVLSYLSGKRFISRREAKI